MCMLVPNVQSLKLYHRLCSGHYAIRSCNMSGQESLTSYFKATLTILLFVGT